MDQHDLRTRLFDAVARGDASEVEELCRANEAEIERSISDWTRVPEELRNERQRLAWYARGLVAVAETFATRLGRPEVLERLARPSDHDPIRSWQVALDEGQSLMNALRFEEGATRLMDLLIDMRDYAGSAVDAIQAVTWGRIGECHFQAGRSSEALAATRQALRSCETQGDEEGVRAYRANLYEIHRWRGEGAAAADEADHLARLLAPPDDARWQHLARLAREGEPLVRVQIESAGRAFEIAEVPVLEGPARFRLVRNRLTLRRASMATHEGETLAARGEFEEALAAFEAAADADPFDPQPHYQAALALLHLERATEAASRFARADELAPGWHLVRAYRWLAEHLLLGTLEHATFMSVRVLEDGALEPAQRVELAREALREAPDVAWLHLLHGRTLLQMGRADEGNAALEAGLRARADEDVRTRLLLERGLAAATDDERRVSLEEAARLAGNLIAGAMASVALRQPSA